MNATSVAPPALQNLAAGDVLGRYELLLPVAQGGMATVWVARMKGTRGFSKIVAIKTMLPALSSDPRFEQMFLSEAELASRIKHPNVCEILDLGEQEGVIYLAMEWIDGESLVTLLGDCEAAGKRVPFAAAAAIGADAARGLHAAHELKDEGGALVGVVHRDVSPHNILVTYDGIVKIVDFGVAKAMARSDHQATNAGHLKGKVHFMAPEQACCDEVDRRTDVFALGIVLYQLTTGRHPFRGDNELATLARITSLDPVASPTTLVPDYPPELAAVLLKALAKEPDQRFASMRDLAEALDAVAGKLAEAGGEAGIEAFVQEALAPRREARAAQLKEGRRAADEREGVRSQRDLAPPSGDSNFPRAPLPSNADAALASPVPTLPPPSRSRTLARSAALVSLGAILGAVALIWATRAGVPAAVNASSMGPQPAAPTAPTASAATTAIEPAAATTGSAAASATASAPTSLAAPAVSAKEARSVTKARPTTTRSEPSGKFRNPGF